MAKRDKPSVSHIQLMLWNKSSRTNDFLAGYVIDVVEQTKRLSFDESKQIFIREKEKLNPKLAGKEFSSHIWVVNLIGGTKRSVYEDLLQPLTRAAVRGDPEFDAPDPEDRVVILGSRKWYFDFVSEQLTDLAEDGEIDLTLVQAESVIRRTDSDPERFSFR